MRARDLLLEYDRTRTLTSRSPRDVVKRLTTPDWRELWVHYDGKAISDVAELARVVQQEVASGWSHGERGYTKWVFDFIMDLCEQADPTVKKKFVPFIFNWYMRTRGMSYLEDISKAYHYLEQFIKFKNRIKDINLSQIDFHDFCDKIDECSVAPSGSEQERIMQQEFFDKGQADLIIDTPDVKVVVPKTPEAAIFFGRNTRWCTSAKHNNLFSRYARQGPLYILLFKKENKRYQFHFESGQYMDEKDEDVLVQIPNLIRPHPELIEWWDEAQRDQMRRPIEAAIHRANFIRHMFYPTFEDWQYAITLYPRATAHMFDSESIFEPEKPVAWNINKLSHAEKEILRSHAQEVAATRRAT